ncbi:MAG: alpha/beta hydrolase, partial [Erythrobacteraceae bacterium]|nr:alpha/beta hydrolase [Erythrobacteraceae bacterium]
MKWLLRIVLLILALLVTAFLIFRTPDTDPAEMRAKYGGEPSQFVEIGDGVTVHLRDEGPKDAPAIILLHGSNADLHTWQPWVDALKARYRVIRFDQVGHGLTGPDP